MRFIKLMQNNFCEKIRFYCHSEVRFRFVDGLNVAYKPVKTPRNNNVRIHASLIVLNRALQTMDLKNVLPIRCAFRFWF